MLNSQQEQYIANVLLAMAENFSAELSTQGVKLYMGCLREYEFEPLKKALFNILNTRKYLKMPTIAEIRENVYGSKEDVAEIEASKVWSAISRYGAYRSVCFDNLTTQATIQSFGGWPSLCHAYKSDQQQFFRKDFIRIYLACDRKNITHVGYFRGIIEGNGGVDKSKVVKIGDKKQCEQIMLQDSKSYGQKFLENLKN